MFGSVSFGTLRVAEWMKILPLTFVCVALLAGRLSDSISKVYVTVPKDAWRGMSITIPARHWMTSCRNCFPRKGERRRKGRNWLTPTPLRKSESQKKNAAAVA